MKTRTELIISLQNEVDLCFEAKKTRDNDGPPYTWRVATTSGLTITCNVPQPRTSVTLDRVWSGAAQRSPGLGTRGRRLGHPLYDRRRLFGHLRSRRVPHQTKHQSLKMDGIKCGLPGLKHGAILYNEAGVFNLSITNPKGRLLLPFDWLIHSSLILASCHRILFFCRFSADEK